MTNFLRILLLATCLIGALVDVAFGDDAGPRGLTADKVAERARRTSPAARADQATSAEADANLRAAGLGWVPRLTAGASYARLSKMDQPDLGPIEVPQLLDQTSTYLSLEVPLSDYLLRTPHRISAAGHSLKAARESQNAGLRAIETDARITFYEWARATMQVEVARQSVQLLTESTETTAAQVDAGRASNAELLRMQARLAESELELSRAVHRAELSEEQLRIAIGASDSEKIALGEDLSSPLAGPVGGDKWSDAIDRRPELKALRAAEAAALDEARYADAGLWPRLSAFAEVAYDNPSDRVFPAEDEFTFSWVAGARLSWNLNDVLGATPSHDAARARAAEHAAEHDQTVNQVRAEVVAADQQAHEAAEAITVGDRGLGAAEESFRVRKELYAVGRATSVELIDAESDLVRARIASIDARIDQRIAKVRLDYASGR